MGDILSQAEIEALLGGGIGQPSAGAGEDIPPDDAPPDDTPLDGLLTNEEKDILGEVGNITMGTSATTLYALLNDYFYSAKQKGISYDDPDLRKKMFADTTANKTPANP